MMNSYKKLTGWRLRFLILILGLGFARQGLADDYLRITKEVLPSCWRLDNIYVLPAQKLEGISARFGGKVTAMKNYIIRAGKLQLQVNVIDCATRADAEGIYARCLSCARIRSFAGCRV